ncbi:MAG: RDD family protein [Nocardioides sp.]|nr:RDD family protein [Nocardioides sp.]
MSTPRRPGPSDPPPYAGSRLGLPADGPGSVAGWGRRLSALTIDWLAASLVVIAFVGVEQWSNSGTASALTLGVFWLEATLLTALMGGSFGQLITRVRVTRLDGRPLDLLRAAGRTLLICLVIPPLVFNPEQRGLHDLATDAVALKL